eukprot:g26524.t1
MELDKHSRSDSTRGAGKSMFWVKTQVVGAGGKAPGLYAPMVKYQVLFLQFTFGLMLTVQEARDGHVAGGAGGGIKMDGNRKVGVVGACLILGAETAEVEE